MSRTVTAFGVAAIVLGSASTGFAADFASAVSAVLSKQKEITDLSADKQQQMIACATQVLQEVPPDKQRYVAEAASYDEMESRFGEVVLADRAEFKQKITKECGEIALAD